MPRPVLLHLDTLVLAWTLCTAAVCSAQAAKVSVQTPTAPARTAPPRAAWQNDPNLLALAKAGLSARAQNIHSQGDAQTHREHVREQMLRLIGPLPERTPLNPVVLGVTTLPGLRIEKVLFDSQPGFHVTALLYVPDTTLVSGRMAAVVMAPGHAPSGKAGDAALAMAFVRNGFVVLSYDPLGQGERLQYPDPKDPQHSLVGAPTGEHGEASLQPILLGESVAKYFLWDGMRAVDYLLTRPEVDPGKIGAFGCSGGGADTALLGAVDTRLAAIGTACYITTWDALLHTLGPQDGEQSTPGWLAPDAFNGPRGLASRPAPALDFADYVEAAAPRPYAIISTTEDMFDFTGAQATEREARAFYKAFHADDRLAFIYGRGRHGQLKPILPRILKFFTDSLQPSLIAPVYDDQSPVLVPPAGALQVTPTGQVSTFDVNAETVFTLNRKHAATLPHPHPASPLLLQTAVRQVTGSTVEPLTRLPQPKRGTAAPVYDSSEPWQSSLATGSVSARMLSESEAASRWEVTIRRQASSLNPAPSPLRFTLAVPKSVAQPGLNLLLRDLGPDPKGIAEESARPDAETARLLAAGHVVLLLAPQPATVHAELKSPVLGPWYLPGLAAELVGRTIVGMRVDDIVLATDYLSRLRMPHEAGISASADSHMALALLHAAAFDLDEKAPRITRLQLTNLPPSYAEILENPMPRGLPEDLLPGVLLHYDTPDLLHLIASRRVQ